MPLDSDFINIKDTERETDIEYWGDTTDPNKHDHNKFRYLTYSTSEMARLSMSFASIHSGDNYSDVNMFMNPDDLDEKKRLNISLIDQDHTSTFYMAGYLVRVPSKNIKVTSPIDAGIAHNEEKSQGNISGSELLNASILGWYNEIVADVKSSAGQIEIVGVFYKVSESGKPLDVITTEKMQQHAHRHGWPIITIVEESGYAEDSFVNTGKRFEINMDNKRYILDYSSSENPKFICLDDTKNESFLDVRDLEKIMLKYGDQIGDIESIIRQKYLEALKEYRKPKIKFDDNGEILSVEIVSSETDGVKFVLKPSGVCDRIYWQKREMDTRRLNADLIDLYTYDELQRDSEFPLSSKDMQNALAQAEYTMSAEEYQKIMDIFDNEELKAKIDERAKSIYIARAQAESNW